MLNFSDSLVVGPSFLHLVPAVANGQGSVPMALREWIENPYVKKCALPISSPEVRRNDVQSCTIFPVG